MPPLHNPEVGEFQRPADVFLFADGWKIIELSEETDLSTVGRLTKNCVGPGWKTRLLPHPENEREALRESFRKQWDTPDYRERYGVDWVAEKIAGADKCPLPANRFFRIMALIDDKNAVHATLILGERSAVDEKRCSYSSSRDLGQATTLAWGGEQYYLLQATYGTAWMPQHVAERCAEWWRSEVEGAWDEGAFQAKVTQYNPGGNRTTYKAAVGY